MPPGHKPVVRKYVVIHNRCVLFASACEGRSIKMFCFAAKVITCNKNVSAASGLLLIGACRGNPGILHMKMAKSLALSALVH